MKNRILNINYFFFVGFITSLIFASCKVPYDPPIKTSGAHYLVVEGYINSNDVPTDIKLSRTRSITWGDTASYINETGAHVEIEDNQNNTYPLYETGGGNYSGTYNLNTSGKYRLHITTTDHKEYLSDFVACKESPPIDNVGWKFNGSDVQVFVNTHDPSNQTKFYRWDYTETWEFHSEYNSILQYNSDTSVSPRSSQVYVCYQTRKASNISVGSSEKLAEDVIHEAPITLIPYHDKRLSVLYSTLVTQFALDSNAYNYWNAMKGNTENVGSIFGTQPNQVKGNIHCVSDNTETVIGYIGAGSTQQARIFIANTSMPADWNQKGNCDYIEVPPIKDSLAFYFGVQGFVPITPHLNGIIVLGYYSSEGPCVDCTLNGSPVKPSFWP
ncbi:MAG: DUF4249 domain-containing protein [Bacteroidota bacterium]|nr:DUF4249 domain-containing protein [Bacteroidota bacterium]